MQYITFSRKASSRELVKSLKAEPIWKNAFVEARGAKSIRKVIEAATSHGSSSAIIVSKDGKGLYYRQLKIAFKGNKRTTKWMPAKRMKA